MTTQHTKSSCCQAPVRRYGERRRQCCQCLTTWRLSPHKQGRKRKRYSRNLLSKVLLQAQSVNDQLVNYPDLTLNGLQKRVQRLVQSAATRPRDYPQLRGQYILIGDGLWYRLDNQDWVLYLFLLKPRRRNYAYLLDPLILPGKESFANWQMAIETIPNNIKERILAFVSDAFRASDKIIRHYQWLHQLCHFHLIAELQKRRGRKKKTIAGKSIREAIYQIIVQLLQADQPKQIKRLKAQLQRLTAKSECPGKLGMIAREFLKHFDKYQTFLNRPDLTIPRTTSAAESLGKLIRRRTRPLNTPQAIQEWATAFVRLKRTMNCNGQNSIKNQPN